MGLNASASQLHNCVGCHRVSFCKRAWRVRSKPITPPGITNMIDRTKRALPGAVHGNVQMAALHHGDRTNGCPGWVGQTESVRNLRCHKRAQRHTQTYTQQRMLVPEVAAAGVSGCVRRGGDGDGCMWAI